MPNGIRLILGAIIIIAIVAYYLTVTPVYNQCHKLGGIMIKEDGNMICIKVEKINLDK